MEGEALRQGKERVQAHLIGPLERAGMQRKGGVAKDAHAAFLDGLRARLAYMDADRLDALAEVIGAMAGGKAKDRWPSEITILNMARRFQVPPPSESRLVRSYLQSAAGRGAKESGCLVELFQFLRKYGQPPNDFGWSEIRRWASDNRSRRARIEREAAKGLASPSDMQSVQLYWETHERCLAIMGDEIGQENDATEGQVTCG